MNMCRMTPLIVAGTITVLEQQRRTRRTGSAANASVAAGRRNRPKEVVN